MYRHVIAMSESKKALHERLGNASVKINEHMITLLMFPNTSNYNHWKQEVYNFVSIVPVLKGTNKWPNRRIILDGLSVYLDRRPLEILKKRVLRDYSHLDALDTSIEAISRALEIYYNFISAELSQYGEVEREAAYQKIDEIVDKYSGR